MVNATIAIMQPLNLSITTAFNSPSKSYMINTILLNVSIFFFFSKNLVDNSDQALSDKRRASVREQLQKPAELQQTQRTQETHHAGAQR